MTFWLVARNSHAFFQLVHISLVFQSCPFLKDVVEKTPNEAKHL